jgi:hypothetical protein
MVVTDAKLMRQCKKLSRSGSVRKVQNSVLKTDIPPTTHCDKCINLQGDYTEKVIILSSREKSYFEQKDAD